MKKMRISIVAILAFIGLSACASTTMDNSTQKKTEIEKIKIEKTEKESEEMVSTDVKTLETIIDTTGNTYLITDGSTGEQRKIVEESERKKLESMLNNIILKEQENEAYYGYSYAIRIMNQGNEIAETITVSKNLIQVEGETGYYFENGENLMEYLDSLYANG